MDEVTELQGAREGGHGTDCRIFGPTTLRYDNFLKSRLLLPPQKGHQSMITSKYQA